MKPPSLLLLLLSCLTFFSIAGEVHATGTPCGRQNNGALCPDGQCCSAAGVCGASATACGKGCQSGSCVFLPWMGENIPPATAGTPTAGSGTGTGTGTSAGSTAATTQASTTTTATAAAPTAPAPPPKGKCTAMVGQVDEFNQKTSCVCQGTVAVTYDDGPSEFTPTLLDSLKAAGLKVTFFVIGQMVSQYPATLKRAYAEGHHIASHTWDHADLATLTVAQVKAELIKNEAIIFQTLGVVPKIMRCPYGSINAAGAKEITRLGYTMIYWNLDTNDWAHPTDTAASMKVYTDTVTPQTTFTSYISLQHDIVQTTVQMAPNVWNHVKKQGFSVVDTPTCLQLTTKDLYWTTLPDPNR